jgi:hypothetical protein
VRSRRRDICEFTTRLPANSSSKVTSRDFFAATSAPTVAFPHFPILGLGVGCVLIRVKYTPVGHIYIYSAVLTSPCGICVMGGSEIGTILIKTPLIFRRVVGSFFLLLKKIVFL